MKPALDNINSLWSCLIVEELWRCGVDCIALSPGSRSAPLIAAAAGHPYLTTMVHPDERGAAFYAVGRAAATGKPVAVLTTSGTATANLLPGIIEASKKKVPIIIITADRPPELQKSGASQTIEQSGLYNSYVRWSFDIPCPCLDIPAKFLLTTVDQAIQRTRGEIPGPVHLNMMFREDQAPNKQSVLKQYIAPLKSWFKTTRPYTTYFPYQLKLSSSVKKEIVSRVQQIHNGIIAVGKLKNSEDVHAVLKLAEHLGFPVFADISSSLRLGTPHPQVISFFDQALLTKRHTKIDGLIHLGGRMTSKRFYGFIESASDIEYISVLDHPLRSDPLHRVTARVQCGIAEFCESVITKTPPRKKSPALDYFTAINQKIRRQVVREFSLLSRSLDEMSIAHIVSSQMLRGQKLFLSNSMPVRDMDMYGALNGESISVSGNRGASGIDGIIASAIGFCHGSQCPVTLVIGDLAFLHDINSLAMLRALRIPLTIILVNNNGGGIFSFLPLRRKKDIFESHICAPHGLNFRKTAEQFEIPYYQALTTSGFIKIYQQAARAGVSSIIECSIVRQQNFMAHERLQRKIMKILP